MKTIQLIIISTLLLLNSCNNEKGEANVNVLFLHHSTGKIIWNGKEPSFINKVLNKISPELAKDIYKGQLPLLFNNYNKQYNTKYEIQEMTFPKSDPYGWENFPFDYYNIWVKHAGNSPYKEEPTLEILTKQYQVIIFKHCFPVCYIQPESDSIDVNSNEKTLGNYKLQYEAIKTKLHQFPKIKFLVITGAAQVKKNISEDSAIRAKEFFSWVKNEWDESDDNIFLWDLYGIQTEGGIYFNEEYAASSNNSHPNTLFAKTASQLLFDRIIDVITTNGEKTKLTGEKN